MGRTARFQEILSRLTMIDECFAEDEAGLGLRLLPGRFVLFLAIFAAARWPMRCLWQFGAGRRPPGLRPVPGRPVAAKVIRGRGR
jgi:hypothetical protein